MRNICIIIENHFHINGFALSLALKVRFFGTRKWPIRVRAREMRGGSPLSLPRAHPRNSYAPKIPVFFPLERLPCRQATEWFDLQKIGHSLQLSGWTVGPTRGSIQNREREGLEKSRAVTGNKYKTDSR